MYPVANDDDDDDDKLSLNLLGCGLLYFRRWLPLFRELYCFNCHGRKSSTRKPQPICQLNCTVHDRPMSSLLAQQFKSSKCLRWHDMCLDNSINKRGRMNIKKGQESQFMR